MWGVGGRVASTNPGGSGQQKDTRAQMEPEVGRAPEPPEAEVLRSGVEGQGACCSCADDDSREGRICPSCLLQRDGARGGGGRTVVLSHTRAAGEGSGCSVTDCCCRVAERVHRSGRRNAAAADGSVSLHSQGGTPVLQVLPGRTQTSAKSLAKGKCRKIRIRDNMGGVSAESASHQ